MELRRWCRDDAEALLAAVKTSPDLETQLGGAQLDTVLNCREFIQHYLSRQDERTHVFAVAVDGQAVGTIGLANIDRDHDTAWAYYWIAQHHRGQRLATRGLAAVASYAYRHLELYRLELGHRVNNPASCAVAKTAGFVPEGLERAKLRYGHQRFDVETHARLAGDPTPTVAQMNMRWPTLN